MTETPGGFRDGTTARDNLAKDEAALRHGVASVRVAVLQDRCVTLGVSQPEDALSARRAAHLGIPVLRRTSGGTGLLHLPGDVAWSIVLPRSHAAASRGFARAYARLGAPAVETLEAFGRPTQWGPSPGTSAEYCLLGPRGETLFAGGRALGGAAQHVTTVALLHHGILNWQIDRPALRELFGLDARTAEGITSLEEIGVTGTPGTFARALAETLQARLGTL